MKEAKMKCLVCGKTLEQMEEGGHLESEQWKGLFHSADTWEITCNYGSSFDTNKYIFGLCDGCIESKIGQGLLIPNGNIRDDMHSHD